MPFAAKQTSRSHSRRLLGALVVASALIAASCAGGQTSDESGLITSTTESSAVPAVSDSAPTSTDQPATTTSTTTTPPSTTLLDPCQSLLEADTSVGVAGGERSFELALPTDMSANKPVPLLILLHGFNGQATRIASLTNLETLAPDVGIALASPQGIDEPATWHYNAQADLGDAEFLDSMYDALTQSPCIDADNVWLSGFSAGSGYTAVFGCPRADRFAGLLMVSGLTPPICPEQSGLDLLIFHGIEDSVVPFGGGDRAAGGETVNLASVPESAAGWADQAGCDPAPVDSTYGDANRSITTTWSACAGESTVRLVAHEGMGHTWPVRTQSTPVVDASCAVLTAMTDPATDPVESCFG